MIKFAFYGRVSTEDQQDPESSHAWQLTRSRALIESRGGVVIYAKLKLTLTYQPEERLMQATIKPGLDMRKGFVSEGGLEPGNR